MSNSFFNNERKQNPLYTKEIKKFFSLLFYERADWLFKRTFVGY